MNKLTGFEISKVFKNKSFYICMAISALISVGLCAAEVLLVSFLGDGMELTGNAFDTMRGFADNGMVVLMLSIMIPLIASEDAANGTLKNIYGKGFSRTDVYLSKFIAVVVATLVFCLVVLAANAAVGFVVYGAGTMGSNFVLSLVTDMVSMLGLASMFFCVAMALGKAGASIAVCIVAPKIITFVLSTASTLLKLQDFSLNDFWLPDVISNTSLMGPTAGDLFKCMGVAVVYMIVFTVLGILLNNRKEV